MKNAVNTIARGIEAGALKTGASMYIGALEEESFDPDEPASYYVIPQLIQTGQDEFEEREFCELEITGPVQVLQKEGFLTHIRVNEGKTFKIKITNISEDVIYEKMMYSNGEVLTNETTATITAVETPESLLIIANYK